MTFAEFRELVLTHFPDAEIGEDNDRQLVLYTNLQVDPDAEAEALAMAGSDADTYSDLMDHTPLIPFEGDSQ